ncbi:hypothetical protein MMC13_007284 [Lambiella insularis]|nr:hypothetical protein [Lambiella insularis]
MLLPSAISCENRSRPSLQHALPFSPPLSPPSSHFSTSIFSTCRALQSLVGVQASARPTQQPRLRSIPTKIEKPKPLRGTKKRRRDSHDEEMRDAVEDQENTCPRMREGCSTPKRQRLAPPSIPLGLDRRDFFALQPTSVPNRQPRNTFTLQNTSPPYEKLDDTPPYVDDHCVDDWDSEDDHALVDLVLEKLRLSKRDWEDCAKALGTDGGSLGRRWKELVGDGEVGLKFRRGRGRSGAGKSDVRNIW